MASALPSPAGGRQLPGPMRDIFEMPRSIRDLNDMLDSLEPVVHELRGVEKDLLEREAQILEKLLRRVGPILTAYAHRCRPSYRGRLTLINETRDVYEDELGGFLTRTGLTYYDTGRLVRHFEVLSWGQRAAEIGTNDDVEISFEAAVQSFGLEAICAGLLDALKNFPIHGSLREYQARLSAATETLNGLGCTSYISEKIERR